MGALSQGGRGPEGAHHLLGGSPASSSAGVPLVRVALRAPNALITGFQALLVNPDIARDAPLVPRRAPGPQGGRLPRRRARGRSCMRYPPRRAGAHRRGAAQRRTTAGVDATPPAVHHPVYRISSAGPTTRASGFALLPRGRERAAIGSRTQVTRTGDGFVEYLRRSDRGLRKPGGGRIPGTASPPPRRHPGGAAHRAGRGPGILHRWRAGAWRGSIASSARARRRGPVHGGRAKLLSRKARRRVLDGGKRAPTPWRLDANQAAGGRRSRPNPGHLPLLARRPGAARASTAWRGNLDVAGEPSLGSASVRSPRGQRPYKPAQLSHNGDPSGPTTTHSSPWDFRTTGCRSLAAQVLSGEYDACRQFSALPAARAVLRDRGATRWRPGGQLPGFVLAASLGLRRVLPDCCGPAWASNPDAPAQDAEESSTPPSCPACCNA